MTFALSTAAGEWTLELTGWVPEPSVLLPATLIVVVLLAWRLGAGPVMSFWLACILTRPLGANIGDYLGSARGDGGIGVGTCGTSVLFFGTVLVLAVDLSRTGRTETILLGHMYSWTDRH